MPKQGAEGICLRDILPKYTKACELRAKIPEGEMRSGEIKAIVQGGKAA